MRFYGIQILVFIFMVAGCSQLDSSRIEIRNNASASMEKVHVEIGGNLIDIGAINAGEVGTATFDVKMDSALKVTYQLNGKPSSLVCVGDIYVTNGVREEIVVDVDNSGDCQVSTGDK